MTKERAISEVMQIYGYLSPDKQQALDVAIEALDQEPCGDCVSRQAVYDLMRSLTRWCVRSEDGKFNNVGLLYDDVMFGIDKLPPVNPQEPKTGHWKTVRCEQTLFCSECNCRLDDEQTYIPLNYCPNCGAKMQEAEE